jgi:carbon monoxide dehydrogenase subunit G
MGRVSASLEVPWPPEVVFDVATRIELLPSWLPDVISAELLDPELRVGSRIRLRMGAAAAGAEVTGTVRQLRPPVILELAGSAGPLTIDVRTRLESKGPSTTRVTLDVAISTPPLLGFIGREAERRINAELPGSVARLRSLIEAEQSADSPMEDPS